MPTPPDSRSRPLVARAAIACSLALTLAGGRDAVAQTLLRTPFVDGVDGGPLGALDLAVADVNGDGHPDLVAASDTGTRLLPGTPDGPYGAAVPFLGGGPLNGCQLADLDGDGLPDLARAPTTGGVFVQRNLGAGTFGAALVLATASPVSTLRFADLDGDGDLDLVVGLYSQQRITVFLGDGAGGFAPGVDEPAPLSVRRIVTGDLDGDGTLDLAVHNHKPNILSAAQASVLRGTGGGAFANPVLISANAADVVVADFTGDGLDDVAVAEQNGPIAVHAGDSLLALPVAFTVPALGSLPKLATGDLDGDGRSDLVQLDVDRLTSHLQAPGGGLGPAIGGGCSNFSVPPLALADLDRDGHLDLAVLHPLIGTISAVFGNGDGSWRTSSLPLSTATTVISANAEIADLDDDGRQDLVETWAGTVPSALRRGGLDGSFGPPLAVDLGPRIVRVFANDSTQDGLLDLVVVRTSPDSSPQGGVALAVGDGRLGFALQPDQTPQTRIVEAEPADVNLDGRTDVLALEAGGAEVLVNDGNGGFSSLAMIELAHTPDDARAADLDHDGDVDLLLAYTTFPSPGFSVSALLVFEQDAGAFTQTGAFSMPGLKQLVLHDLDGDGHLDVLGASQPLPGDVGLLRRNGLGDGSFGALQSVTVPDSTSVRSLALAELDGDAQAEVVLGTGAVGGYGDLYVFDLVGGVPLLAETHRSGVPPVRLEAVDANGDGAQDVLVVSDLPSFLLRNTSGPWTRLGLPIAGAAGDSLLAGEGPLQPGSALRLSIVGMKPLTATLLVIGLAELGAPFKGGVLVPSPTLIFPVGPTNLAGDRVLSATWPASLPSGFTVVMQAWQADAAGPAGFASTNGLRGTAP